MRLQMSGLCIAVVRLIDGIRMEALTETKMWHTIISNKMYVTGGRNALLYRIWDSEC